MDKLKLKDSRGRPLTQSLFLEVGYNTEFAVYTLKDEDFVYHGKTYPSLKRLYLEMEDVIEYEFATTYLLGWEHWQRIADNKLFSKKINSWRNELELKLRSQAVKDIIDLTAEDKSFQAAKWLADKGWGKNPVGRPSKASKFDEDEFNAQMEQEYGGVIAQFKKKEAK